tara:strand:+ start:1272 stop:1571 length:300 start_codon:yes stop_codon:yes gene_type:complete
MKIEIINAAKAYFEGAKQKHIINALLILEKPAAVAEHPDMIATLETELSQVAHYNDMLEALQEVGPMNRNRSILTEDSMDGVTGGLGTDSITVTAPTEP